MVSPIHVFKNRLDTNLSVLSILVALFLFTTFPTLADELIEFQAHVSSQSTIPLTPKQKAWLRTHNEIRVAVKSGWMPIEFKLENERHRGISIDYLTKVANLLQMNIRVINYDDKINLAEIDLVSGVTSRSLPGAEFKLLKQPFLIIPNAIYINQYITKKSDANNLEELRHSKVAVFKSGSLPSKIRETYSDIQLVNTDIADEAFDYLKSGQVKSYVGNELVVDYHVEYHRLNYVQKSGLSPFTSDIFMAVNTDQPELYGLMEIALRKIGQNNKEILDNWRISKNEVERLLKLALFVILVVFVMLLVRFYLLKRSIKIQDAVNQQKIWHQANFDFLTHLPNRHLLQNRLQQAIARADRQSMKVGLLFIDLDNFKHVNDSAGHSVGDKLLQEAAERITRHIREEDTTARFGGDEFMVVLSDLKDLYGLEKICNKIIREIERPFLIGKERFFVSASMGVTVYPDDGRNTEELLSYADQAMYEAKKLGKNRYQFFTESMQKESNNRLAIIKDLRQAIQQNQLVLYYQPIVCLRTFKVLKAEALIRWNHPEKGLIGPNDFIYLAEESGLIHELGAWIFMQAINDLNMIHTELGFNFQVSINVSPYQFSNTQHLLEVIHLLKEHHIQGDRICIEITERLLLEPTDEVIEIIQTFRETGIEFSIDDFGTGYSALAYLKKFNIDYVKIDKSFIQNLEFDNYDAILCESIIQMAHKLGIKLIAEGVEDTNQKKMLEEFECDYVQGYLFAKPKPLIQLINFIKKNNN